jgi:hypothetical protein
VTVPDAGLSLTVTCTPLSISSAIRFRAIYGWRCEDLQGAWGSGLPAETPKGGETTVDFNKAYNLYCAVDPYASCPVPPVHNRLPVRILAGETCKGP